MSYAIFILPRAQKEIATLPHDTQDRIDEAISSLGNEPRPKNSRKLRSRHGWRMRVGQYRVIYEIDDASKKVVILNVGHRRDVYR